MKIVKFIWGNILFFITLFLLAFIPLYPKIPLLDVVNTWVYVRVEDFLVALAILVYVALLLRKKITLKTPLTIPILLFWVIGGLSMLHGVMLLFPTLSDVFSNVAFLSFLRRIEYMFLFFVAYEGMKDKRFIKYIVWALPIILLLIIAYGFGQKFLGFPAYLTMNEEFAKGIPIQLSQLSRVPSTFAGHYDLAAYLVLVIPLLVSIAFGLKNWFARIFMLATSSLGLALLFMTVSRVSVVVLLLSLVLLLLFQRKKWVIASLFVLTLLFLILSPSLLKRFGSTVSETDVLVDAKTGGAIGRVKQVPKKYFEDKIVLREFTSKSDTKIATSSSIVVPYSLLPQEADLVVEPNSPNGESLPQGTSYINLPLSPIIKKVDEYYYQKSQTSTGASAQVRVFSGEFVIKKAKAYDLSFTTRFQGEWPRTILAFKRNIFLGSGYGSVSLAVDNDYLRLLGESGILGLLSFLSIFAISGIYIKKILPKVQSSLVRSFVLGFIAGTFGLFLNALLIDVFEASKVAFVYWMLMGLTFGMLSFYNRFAKTPGFQTEDEGEARFQDSAALSGEALESLKYKKTPDSQSAEAYKDFEIDVYKELKKLVTSLYAIIVYLFILTYALFSPAPSYYFVGDDFTWLHWVASCTQNCSPLSLIFDYFTKADGFFYRPGAKLYFDLMYQVFWLNQSVYHFVSLAAHFLVAVLIFLISKRILKNYLLSVGSAVVFLMLSGFHEAVFWISSTGFLFNAVFALLSLLFFIYWKERKNKIYLAGSFIAIIASLLFHEVGIIVPLLIICYDVVFGESVSLGTLSKKSYWLFLLSPILPYLLLRFIAGSHWFNGDYSYNLLKLPFNFVGNAFGYFSLAFLGPSSLSIYEKLRVLSKNHIAIALLGSLAIVIFAIFLYKKFVDKMDLHDKKIITFGFLFFIIALLPFLGLGNIASRYSYLPSFGFVLIFVVFIEKIYYYLLSSGKQIAILSLSILIIIFSSLQLFQLQKVHSDWSHAGDKSKSILNSLDYIYAHYSTEDTKQLYFINVPIREGEAWVFPVGLSDALWLVFRRSDIKVYQVSSPQDAFNLMGQTKGRVFQFDVQGNLIEFVKTSSGEISSIER